MKKINIKDVATYAGVSASSVSRYLTDPNSINPIPAMKIENAIKTLGYIPNTFAQSLKRGHSNTIGVVVPELGPFYSRICSALSDFFYQHHYLLFICKTENDAEKERHFISALLGQQVAGLIVAPSGENDEFLIKLNEQFSNIIILDHCNENLPFDAVYSDNYHSSYQLTKHLLDKGHQHIAALFHAPHYTNTKQRMQGFSKAFEDAGIDINGSYIKCVDGDEKDFHQLVHSLLDHHPRPTAVAAYSPLYLENTLAVLNQLGLQIPEDIELSGYALEDFSSKYRIDIPRVIQSPYDMGLQAGDILLKKLRKGNASNTKSYCLPMSLILPAGISGKKEAL